MNTEHDDSRLQGHIRDEKDLCTNQLTGAMDIERERIELLSAYIDNEVNTTERYQVQEWLANDPAMQHLHSQMLKVKEGLRHLPVPSQQPVEETVEKVMARLRRRSRVVWLCSGAAVAACVIGAFSGIISGGESGVLRLAEQPNEQSQPLANDSSESLMVAINNPPLRIPKAAKTHFEDSTTNQDIN